MMINCKLAGYCDNGLKCSECPDYEQDPQIARDNDTMNIATREPNYEKLFKMQSVILVNQHEEINKLNYDNNLMADFIMINNHGGSDGK